MTKQTQKIASLTMARMSLADLKPHPRNPRRHPAPGSPAWNTLRRSLQNAYWDPIIWNRRNGCMVGGHLRPWGSAHFAPERLDQPAKVRKPGRVFVCSMADIGHETVKPEWREAVYSAMRAAPWHTFIVLTKRPGTWLREVPLCAWVGVTVEAQEHVGRWRVLCDWAPPRAVKFVSIEPMLGRVSIEHGSSIAPDWVIAGPETGPKARRCEDAWIEALAAEEPCFFDKRNTWKRREFPK